MKYWNLVLTSIVLAISSSANAALISRLGGQAAYDTDLDITWLTNTQAAAGTAFADPYGAMSWGNSKAWAASLIVDGHSGWRLPTTSTIDSSCTLDHAGALPSTVVSGWNCNGSEMGHLFYNELGGTAGGNIINSTDPDLALFSFSPWLLFWSDTPYDNDGINAWAFNFSSGEQTGSYSLAGYQALAVRDGDIALATVPVPAAVWLFGSGLIGLAGVAKRKKA